MKSCCFAVLFLVIVSCILVADAAEGYRNRKRSSDDSADSIINKIDANLNLEDGDIVERGLDHGKRNSDDVSVDKINLNLKDGDKTDVERSSEIDESTFTDGDLLGKRAAKKNVIVWPDGVVPYIISSTINSDVKETSNIKQAMKNIEAKTCITFRPKKSGDSNYLYYTRGVGCSSPLGMVRSNRITLQKGCASEVGVVEHEILHSLGFWHEQSRPDRDQFIKINFDNIKKANVHNFNVHSDADTQGLAYDFESLMHYGNKDFTSNGKQTIESKTDPTKHLGNRKGMTALDIEGIKILYECGKDKHDTNFDNGAGLWGNVGIMKFKMYSKNPYADKEGPAKDHTSGSGKFAQLDYKPRVTTNPRGILGTRIDPTPEGCTMKFYFYKGAKGLFYIVTQSDTKKYSYYKQGSSTIWKEHTHSIVKGTVLVLFYGVPDRYGDIALAIDDVKFENCA